MGHYLVAAIIDVIVALIALSKRTPAGKGVALTSFSLGLWSFELFLLTVIKDVELLSIWFHVTRWGMFFIPPSLAFLTWMMLGAKSTTFRNLVVIPGFLVSASLSFFNTFIFPSDLIPASGGFLPKIDTVFHLFVINVIWCVMGAVVLGAVSYASPRSTNRQKQRIKWLLIILLMTLSTGLASIFLVAYDFYLKLVGTTTNITFVSLLFYATFQNHLMDLRLALSFGLARVALFIGVVWSYLFVSSLLNESDNAVTGSIAMLVFIMVMLEVYPRALRWILPGAKKLISNSNYDLDSVKVEARTALNKSLSLKSLNRVLDFLFKRITQVTSFEAYVWDGNGYRYISSLAPVYLSDEDKVLVDYGINSEGLVLADESSESIQEIMERHGANAYFSIGHDTEALGIVLIGPAEGESYYRYDDICLFEWLSEELGSVISRITQLDEMQAQLGQAKKTLSMLGVMNHYHHDIKAPLAIIDGVLSNDIYDKEKQKDIVLQQVERGSRLIATMAGILKGERKRKVQPLSLREVVKDSLFLFSQGIDNIHYKFDDLPMIYGDAEDLKILVINLVKNAIEARREGASLELTITGEQSEEFITLSIADTGMGISPERVNILWDDIDSSKANGSGVGMQAIKRIADEHSAEIVVNSSEGEGSEFIFKFPCSIAVENPTDEASEGDNPFANQDRLTKPATR